jgi:hypothetical protein
MKLSRLVLGKCGGCKIHGVAVVEVERSGEWYGTPRNLISPMEVVASADKKVWQKYGFEKFQTQEEAEKFARGAT